MGRLSAVVLVFAGALAYSQSPPAQTALPQQGQPAPESNAAEVGTQDAGITFKSRVNLVLVPVVVRDKKGNPIPGLTKEDFQLFDKGKPQTITKFAVETAASRVVQPAPKAERSPDETSGSADSSDVVAPDHFVALFFDDIHISFTDLVPTRDAARRYVLDRLGPKDRAAIYTTSGQTTLDFTDDRVALIGALDQLRARPIARSLAQECPDISHYMADLIVNKNDPIALLAAGQEAYDCMNMSPPQTVAKDGVDAARPVAYRVLTTSDHETQIALLTLKQLVRRMSAMPGTRLILMMSPGFIRPADQLPDESDTIDRAIRANVTISSIDARGLYTDTPDIARRTLSLNASVQKRQYEIASNRANADVLAEFADATGGSFFENNNDLEKGVSDLATVPAVYYVLAFSPQNLKLDGAYHNLTVRVRNPVGISAKARRGYFAPRHLTDADEEAKEEIEEALFSREEMKDIPLDFHTQFFKAGPEEARLVIVTRLDVRKLRYRKADGRNGDEVLVVSGLFDRNGNFVQAVSKKVTMRLRDETLATKLNSGISLRSDFKVVPGKYIVRLVVRDAEGQMMAAQNGAVEIP